LYALNPEQFPQVRPFSAHEREMRFIRFLQTKNQSTHTPSLLINFF